MHLLAVTQTSSVCIHFQTKATSHSWALSLQYDDMDQWLQVELTQVKKITGIVTQGARFLGAEMFVSSFSLMYSHDGRHWHPYTDDDSVPAKVGHMNHIPAILFFILAHFNLWLSPSTNNRFLWQIQTTTTT